jgi:hypothetical protein
MLPLPKKQILKCLKNRKKLAIYLHISCAHAEFLVCAKKKKICMAKTYFRKLAFLKTTLGARRMWMYAQHCYHFKKKSKNMHLKSEEDIGT